MTWYCTGTALQKKFKGGAVDIRWVLRLVNNRLHGLGKPVPLEFDRSKWCTSANLRHYYDLVRDTALAHLKVLQ